LFPFKNVLPVPFPFYLDFYNLNDLPIWGADFFFNQNQNVFGVSESYESWFFSKQYANHFPSAKKAVISNKNNFYFL
jgi:hypothetical protein